GLYTFYTASDDGSQLFLGGTLVVDNDGIHGFQERASAPVFLEAGYHLVVVTFFELQGGQELEVSWSGPGFAQQEIPAGLLYYEIPPPLALAPLLPPQVLDPAFFAEGVAWEEFFGSFFNLPDFDKLGGLKLSGVASNYTLEDLNLDDQFARRYVGLLWIDTPGEYTFYTESDDGSQLWIGENLAVNNDGLHGAQRQDSLPVLLEPGWYVITVLMFEFYGDEYLEAGYAGPGFAATTFPDAALYHLIPDPPPAPVALSPADGAVTDAVRLLSQASFGPDEETIQAIVDAGARRWIADQMKPSVTPVSSFSDPGIETPQDRLDRWWYNAIEGPDQLRQRVALALSEIFVVSDRNAELIGRPEALASYMDMLSRNAFGSYRQLLEDVTLHPSMGLFLSSIRNRPPGPGIDPDQNYAREALQLFSMGLVQLRPTGRPERDGDGNTIPTYDQSIIEGFAHVYTGWTYSDDTACDFDSDPTYLNATEPMRLCQAYHDTGPKKVLDHPNNPPDLCDPAFTDGCYLPAGQSGAEDLADALDNIASHPNVGPFMSRQLIQRLVTSNPTPGYVYRVARVFDRTRGNLAQVITAILTDREARNPAFTRYPFYGKVREPMLAFTQLYRAFDLYIRDPDPYDGEPASAFRFERSEEESQAAMLGQAPLSAPSVFNFFSPDHQHPGITADLGLEVPELQIVTEATVVSVANAMLWRVIDFGHSNLDIANELALIDQPAVLVDHLDALLMAGQMSQALKDQLLPILASPEGTPLQLMQVALYLIFTSPDYMIQR
ncbi:MAG: DUF1800 family protein, partial [Gammaproteobacteria bacterium]|nr:DUF1800 family protein [Gammaproteobacteria bacterium]